MPLLIDRSNNNGADNYAAAKNAGVTHAYFKATDGTDFVDSTFLTRRAEAHAAGIVAGGYHFAEHGDPIAEANHFLSVVGHPRAGQLRPCLDLESGEDEAWTAAFVSHLKTELGYWPVLYGNTSTIPALRSASASIKACPWWRAEYGPNDGTRHPLQGGDQGASAHQYTSVAHIAGISGNTDASVFLEPVAVMLVPTPAKKAKKWAKPDHYEVHYTDVFGDAQVVKTKHPGLWEHRHPLARRRSHTGLAGVHVIPKFKP